MTFSFYEPMTLSQLILDFDESEVRNFKDFNQDMLNTIIQKLESEKKLKKIIIKNETGWIRVQPKKSFLKRLFS